jgi:hypothetical protein
MFGFYSFFLKKSCWIVVAPMEGNDNGRQQIANGVSNLSLLWKGVIELKDWEGM